LEVINQEPHVCPELPDGSQLHCPTPELHQVGPALLETHLCPPECQEELEQQVVPAMKEMEDERMNRMEEDKARCIMQQLHC